MIDGGPISSGEVLELVRAPLEIGGHREEVAAFVTLLGQYPLVLVIPWLSFHHVNVDFRTSHIASKHLKPIKKGNGFANLLYLVTARYTKWSTF